MFLRAPIEEPAAHLCVDMQRLLDGAGAGKGDPAGRAAARANDLHPVRSAALARADAWAWRRYFEKWRSVTRDFIEPALLPPLAEFAPPAVIVDKGRYSAFVESELQPILRGRGITALIVSGAEPESASFPPSSAPSISAIASS